jgi:hypothetical protein
MSPIPGEPLNPDRRELTTKDGRRVKLKVPGLGPAMKETGTAENKDERPPPADPRPPINPNHVGF